MGCVENDKKAKQTDMGMFHIIEEYSCPLICEISHYHYAKHKSLCDDPCTQITYNDIY